MSNTLTNLLPTIYEAVDVVSRELCGFIPAVTLDASSEEAALNQTVRWPVAPANTAATITPAATGPDPSAQTIGSDTMSISKLKGATFFWEGEEKNTARFENIMRDQFAQAMRVLANEVEADLAALYVAASRAYGTAAQTPFGTNLDESANVLKILLDNGAPSSDLQLIIDTAAGAKLRTLGQLTKANEAADDSLLRRGILLDIHGFKIRESAQVKTHTKGTGAGYLVDLLAGYDIGDTTIHVDTGTGTILAGDIFGFQSDTNKYVIKTGFAGDGDGDIVIAEPGLRAALADGKTLTPLANYTANMAFARSAIRLMCRVPKLPDGGDSADEVEIVTDPVSGISFAISLYRQYKRVAYEVGLAWGVKAAKPEHIAIMVG